MTGPPSCERSDGTSDVKARHLMPRHPGQPRSKARPLAPSTAGNNGFGHRKTPEPPDGSASRLDLRCWHRESADGGCRQRRTPDHDVPTDDGPPTSHRIRRRPPGRPPRTKSAQARASRELGRSDIDEPLPPTRSPLAALRRRLAGRRVVRLSSELDRGAFAAVMPSPTMEDVATRVSSPQFIGRDAELAALTEAVARAAAGDASVVLVGGEAGIGKTRLIAEVAGSGSTGRGDRARGRMRQPRRRRRPPVRAVRRGAPAAAGGPRRGPIRRRSTWRTCGRRRRPSSVDCMPEFGMPTGEDRRRLRPAPTGCRPRIFEGLLALLRDLGERAPGRVLSSRTSTGPTDRPAISWPSSRGISEPSGWSSSGPIGPTSSIAAIPLRPWLSEMERLPRVRRLELSPFGRPSWMPRSRRSSGTRRNRTCRGHRARAEGQPVLHRGTAGGRSRRRVAAPLACRRRCATCCCPAWPPCPRSPAGPRHRRGGRAIRGPELLAEVAAVPEAELEDPLREALAAQLLVRTTSMTRAPINSATPCSPRPSTTTSCRRSGVVCTPPTPPPRRTARARRRRGRQPAGGAGPSRDGRPRAGARPAGVDRGGRAASEAYAFAESVRAFERAIELWDAVPADDRPSDVDPVPLYHEASLSAMVGEPAGTSASSWLAKRSAWLDPVREPERWAAANERLARASWVSGATTRTRCGSSKPRPRPWNAPAIAGRPASSPRSRASTCSEGDHAAGDRGREGGDRPRPGDRTRTLAEAHAMITLGRARRCWALRRGPADPARRLRPHAASGDVHDLGRAYANLGSALLDLWRPRGEHRGVRGGRRLVPPGRHLRAVRPLPRRQRRRDVDRPRPLGRRPNAWSTNCSARQLFGVNRIGVIGASGTFLVRRGRLATAAPLLAEGRALVEPMRDAQFTGPTYVGLTELSPDRTETRSKPRRSPRRGSSASTDRRSLLRDRARGDARPGRGRCRRLGPRPPGGSGRGSRRRAGT